LLSDPYERGRVDRPAAGTRARRNEAVSSLGKKDGFLLNKQVKIPLPPRLAKAEKVMRMAGMGAQADDLVLAMNRAAEAAVPEAKPLLLDAVKSMSVGDAKKILTGGDDSVTQFFKTKTSDPLMLKFMPIVQKYTANADLAKKYNKFAGMVPADGDSSSRKTRISTAMSRVLLSMGSTKSSARKRRPFARIPPRRLAVWRRRCSARSGDRTQTSPLRSPHHRRREPLRTSDRKRKKQTRLYQLQLEHNGLALPISYQIHPRIQRRLDGTACSALAPTLNSAASGTLAVIASFANNLVVGPSFLFSSGPFRIA